MSTLAPRELDTVVPGGPWLTPDVEHIDRVAVSLLDHPDVVAARARAIEKFEASSEYAVADAPARMAAAVDNLLFSCLQWAANADPIRPRVGWTVRLPYTAGELEVPDSHYGADSPDRVYRFIGVSPEHSYEITGRRHPTHPSVDDLSFEAIPPPGLYGQPLVRLDRAQIDIDPDGSFAVVADATETNGRRNHLHLPPDALAIVVRDTLLDWAHQLPNQVEVSLTGGPELPEYTKDEIAAEGAAIFGQCVEMTLGLLRNCLRGLPANELMAFERPVHWGMAGNLFALQRFELGESEALVLTLDPLSARYMAIAACDPWATSVAYDRHCSCLNHAQAQPNEDGTFTFVVSPEDPGVFNWLETGGLRTGAIVARWESLAEPPAEAGGGGEEKSPEWAPGNRVVDQAVRDARVVELDELDVAVPPGQTRVTGDRRRQLQAERLADHSVRMTGQIRGETA
jgi:hypothetical protein